ncbi:MAG: IS21 family transposase, partial [Chloroflexota bacterium]|nr:IS21 family transposase [Chloroflexota bacterium]
TEDFAVIKALAKRGVYLKDSATELGVHPKTVRRALQRGSAPVHQRPHRPSKLDPYKPLVDRLLSEGVWNSVVILRELEQAGYQGSRTILREYIAPKRALRPSRATVRFETAPGHQLQSDWGELVTELAGQSTKVCFIVNQLGYSRRFHFWCAAHQDAEHTYEGLIRSFEYFGGVPQEVLVDNQKAAVLVHHHDTLRFNARFGDLAAYYGFTPKACRPYRARTKGKDERMVGYIKQHFFVRYRAFESWAHLNQLAEQWLRQEADLRLHGTVHEVVAERFTREQPTLRPLPAQRYDTAYYEHRQVSWDSYIEVRGNRYSVPAALVGTVVAVRIGLDDTLHVYAAEQLVATHHLQSVQEGWVTVAAHHRSLWQAVEPVEQRPLSVYEEVASWS